MENLYVRKMIEPMGDEYFKLLKDRLVQYSSFLCTPRGNRLGSGLLQLICAENIIASVNREQLVGVLRDLLPEQMKDSKWLLRYIEELYNYIPDENEKLYLQGRGLKYYKHMGERVKELKAAYAKIGEADDELILSLIDLVKLIICVNALNDANSANHKRTDDLDLELSTDKIRVLLKQMVGSIEQESAEDEDAPAEEKKERAKPKFPAIHIELPKDAKDLLKPKHTLKYREKLAALMLTWLLYYRACEQDGIPAVEVAE